MRGKLAIVTGAAGQDGSYMCDQLISEGVHVYGLVRPTVNGVYPNLRKSADHPLFTLIHCDLLDEKTLSDLVSVVRPHYFFNFAGETSVGESWDRPKDFMASNVVAVAMQLKILSDKSPTCKYINAGSSEELGNKMFQDPFNPKFHPISPYGVSKLAARHLIQVYRDKGMWACQPYLFNHDSPRRSGDFLLKKVAKHACSFHKINEALRVGNISAVRDWSHARDVVSAILLLAKQKDPFDYQIGSGDSISVKQLIQEIYTTAFCCEGSWVSCDENQEFTVGEMTVLISDYSLFRPTEIKHSYCDNTEIKELGWTPTFLRKDLIKDCLRVTSYS